jgi:hypothetical protein
MPIFSKEEQNYIDRLSAALRNIKVADKEMDDMRLLYKCTNGIPIEEFDVRNRPQGPTIPSSRTLGSKVRSAIGAPASHYGMSFVGYDRGDAHWCMKDVFRAAIDQANFFGAHPVVADEIIPREEVEDDLNEEDEIVHQILTDESLSETVREQLVKARIGQGKFRSRVEIVSPTCRVTGISYNKCLIASHIKPWCVCSNEERLDGNNGLMLSPHIDQLFDDGYITFEDDGSLIVSSALPSEVLAAWSIDVGVNSGKLNEHQSRYMVYHRESVFLG